MTSRARRVTAPAAVAAAGFLAAVSLASCSGSKPPPPTAASTSTSTVVATTTVPPLATTTTTSTPLPPACTNATVTAGWTLSRKAAELVVVPVVDANPAAVFVAMAQNAGGVLLLGTVPSAAQLRSALAPAGRRVLVMTDEEGGGVQRLQPDVESVPWARTMAATMTPAQVRALARSVGTQMLSLGVDVDLAPVADVDGGATLSASDPDGPRSFSPDAATAGTYAVAFEQGLRDAGVLPVVKHFPGLGGSTGNTDFGPASTQSISSLRSSGLLPFERAVAAGAPAVMVANATVPGFTTKPASVSPTVVNGLLRQQIGFKGLVMTDSLSAGAISSAGYTVESAAVAAIASGVDMILFGSTLTAADRAAMAPGPLTQTVRSIVGAVVAAVRSGVIPASRLDAAVDHVLSAGRIDLCRR